MSLEQTNFEQIGRQHLPDRRNSVAFEFEFEGFTYRASAGQFSDGRLAEIFLDVPGKLGSPVQSNANTVAVLASLLLQHGISPEIISHSATGPIVIAIAGFSEMFEQGKPA
jgi:hypothetical protein